MDARSILDQLLASGQELAGNARDFAESKLGVPTSGEDRSAMLSGIGKGAAVGGLLALMLGTKTGRNVTGKALKYGSLAAVAAVAYKSYQSWQAGNQSADEAQGMPITNLPPAAAADRSLVLLRAMIAAANADGHIDTDERSRIESQLQSMSLGDETRQLLEQELRNPVGLAELAAGADSPAAAAELYFLSSLVVDQRDPKEAAYMEQLANALKLPIDLVAHLDTESQVQS